MKTYTDRPTWYAYPEEGERTAPRDRHATISVIKHRMDKLDAVDNYLYDCEQRFKVEYLKRLNGSTISAWENTMKELNTQLFPRGKNTVLECLQFVDLYGDRHALISESYYVRGFKFGLRLAVECFDFSDVDENQ